MRKKDINYKRKNRRQFIIWILEGLFIPMIIIYLFGGFNFSEYETVPEFVFNIETLNNLILTGSIYQLLIFIFNKSQRTGKQDMLLSLIYICKLLKVVMQVDESNSRKQIELENLLDKMNILKEGGYMVDTKYIEELETIKKYILYSQDNVAQKQIRDILEIKIINYEHEYEMLNLEWNNSLLVKLLK